MLNVPYEVKKLFEQDSISKNFRVHFVNGEYRDLVNADIVSESVVFTDSVSSDNIVKFGVAESPILEFSTYFPHNLDSCEIFCGIEIDISSLPEQFIIDNGRSSEDVPYPYYFVPYGYFIVYSSMKDSNGIRKIVSYANTKFVTDLIDTMYASPECLKASLLWGTRYQDSLPQGTYIKIGILEHLGSMLTSVDSVFKDNCVAMYDKDSSIFDYSKNPNFSGITGKALYEAEHPVIKAARINLPVDLSTTVMDYFIHVKGVKIVFEDNHIAVYQYNHNGFPIGMGSSWKNPQPQWTSEYDYKQLSTKRLIELDYNLPEDNLYELSWENSISEITAESFPDNPDAQRIYNYLQTTYIDSDNKVTYFDALCSPCLKFMDDPEYFRTYLGILNISEVIRFDEHLDTFPVAHNTYVSTTVEQSSFSDTRHTRDYVYTAQYGTNINSHYLDELTSQRYVNVSPHKVTESGSGKILNVLSVFPKFADIFSSIQDLDESKKHTHYLDYMWSISSDNIVSTEIPCHVELCIPTEMLIGYHEHPVNVERFYDFPTCYYSNSVPEVIDKFKDTHFTVTINTFDNVKLKQYSFSDEPLKQLCSNIPTTVNSQEYTHENYNHVDVPRGDCLSYYIQAATDFSGYFDITQSFSSIIKDFAELQAKLLRAKRDEKGAFEFVRISEPLDALYPSEDIYPAQTLFPESAGYNITRSMWRKLIMDEYARYSYSRVVCKVISGGEEITIYADVGNDGISDYREYDITENWFIQHMSPSLLDVHEIVNNIATEIRRLIGYPTNMTMRGLPFIESGDILRVISKDTVTAIVCLRQRISGIQNVITNVENR